MRVVGVDFTSAPKRDKPIVVADCDAQSEQLSLRRFLEFSDWPAFELWLRSDGPWIGGFDFPFGLPSRFVRAKGWPTDDWSKMVNACVREGKERFVLDAMQSFQSAKEKLDKHRATDLAARSESPLKTRANPPVGLMFYEGAWRLAGCDLHVPGLRSSKSDKVALEAFPGLAIQRLGERYYKNDKTTSADDNIAARTRILQRLQAKDDNALKCRISVPSSSLKDRMMHASGDWLDAVLCATQAHWGWTRKEKNFGLPTGVNPVEGWIISA